MYCNNLSGFNTLQVGLWLQKEGLIHFYTEIYFFLLSLQSDEKVNHASCIKKALGFLLWYLHKMNSFYSFGKASLPPVCVKREESSLRLVREEQLPFPLRQVTDLRGNGVLWGEVNLEDHFALVVPQTSRTYFSSLNFTCYPLSASSFVIILPSVSTY